MTAKIKLKDETIIKTEALSVAIPENLSLTVVGFWANKSDGSRTVVIHATATPYNSKDIQYRWSSSKGLIFPCVQIKAIENNLGITGNLADLQLDRNISIQNMSPSLVQTLVAELSEEEEEEVSEEDLVITSSAVTSNNINQINSVVLGVAKKSVQVESTSPVSNATVAGQVNSATLLNNSPTTVQLPDKYVILSNQDDYMAPLPRPEEYPLYEMFINIPTDDPSYAVLYYSGGGATVNCTFISPCNENLTASVSVYFSGRDFLCSYTNGSHSITITNEDTGGNNNENGNENGNGNGNNLTDNNYYWVSDPNIGANYQVYIYNDYGLVKTVDLDASVSRLDIPMDGYPNGFYYVNIVDPQGNVVKRQIVQVY